MVVTIWIFGRVLFAIILLLLYGTTSRVLKNLKKRVYFDSMMTSCLYQPMNSDIWDTKCLYLFYLPIRQLSIYNFSLWHFNTLTLFSKTPPCCALIQLNFIELDPTVNLTVSWGLGRVLFFGQISSLPPSSQPHSFVVRTLENPLRWSYFFVFN